MTEILLILAVIAVGTFIACLLSYRPEIKGVDEAAQADSLNSDLKAYGFAYDPDEDIFYSLKDCPQREAGYCRLYDDLSVAFSMVIDCEPITFNYKGKRWLIEFWKGQYGMTCGAEIGVYNTSADPSADNPSTGTLYRNISGSEMLPMEFMLKKGRRIIMRRDAVHWWMTGFKLGEFCEPHELEMDARLKFPDREMLGEFIGGLKRAGYSNDEYSVFGRTVTVRFATPHVPQPGPLMGASRKIVQLANKNHCNAYRALTADYPKTLDKIEYIKRSSPTLYSAVTASLPSRIYSHAMKLISQSQDEGSK